MWLAKLVSPVETVKRDCFSKRESEDAARDTYYEFAGEKLRALVVPVWLNSALSRKPNPLTEGLTALSRACWERGCELPSLALRKLFEKSSEAYHAWNAALPGHVAPHAKLGAPFTTTAELQDRFARAVSLREQLRAEMIALQEEMDWLVYAAYGLLDCGGKRSATPLSAGAEPLSAASQSAVTADVLPAHSILPLQESERPFRLWESASGDFARAVSSFPLVGRSRAALYGNRASPPSATTNTSAASSNRSINAVGMSNGK